MKQAVIVAAGLSSRLYPLTENMPKSLLEINGESIIKRNVKLLKKMGIENIFVVTGFLDNKLKDELEDAVMYIYNPYFKYCNNMGSLYTAKPYLKEEPFLYMHADIMFTEKLLQNFVNQVNSIDKAIHLAVDFKDTDEEAMKVSLREDGDLLASDKAISDNSVGEWTGIAYIQDTVTTFTYIEQALREGFMQKYDTFAFTKMAADDIAIGCHSTQNESWIEIDFIEDYKEAKRMFINE